MAKSKRRSKKAAEIKRQEKQFWKTVGIVTGAVLLLLFIGFMNA